MTYRGFEAYTTSPSYAGTTNFATGYIAITPRTVYQFMFCKTPTITPTGFQNNLTIESRKKSQHILNAHSGHAASRQCQYSAHLDSLGSSSGSRTSSGSGGLRGRLLMIVWSGYSAGSGNSLFPRFVMCPGNGDVEAANR